MSDLDGEEPATSNRILATVIVMSAVALVTAGCAGSADGTSTPTSSESEPSSDAASTLPEPRTLFEWYPADADRKSIVVSDATASVPAVAIVPDSTANNVHANWSPDGSELTWEVLADNDTSTVWTAEADGSGPTLEVECPGDPCVEMSWPSFSPDGAHLLVTRYDIADTGDWGPSHLVSVDRATGVQQILASTIDGATAFYSASWSPDGSHVAAQLESYPDATESEIAGSVIVIVDTDLATAKLLAPITDPALFAGYPRWHPTDAKILFASWDLNAFQDDKPSQLYTVNPDGTDTTQITQVDPASGTRPGEASWTPDGTAIIAALGIVTDEEVTDVKVSFIDPETGSITQSEQSGAMPTLQPSN